MVRSLGFGRDLGHCGPRPGTCCRIRGGELDHQLPPLLAPGGTWMLEVAGGNRHKVGETQRWCTTARTVDPGTRESGVLGDTSVREKSGAMSDLDPDNLQTG